MVASRAMDAPLSNVITLGARDLAAQREFYRRLGFEAVFEDEDFTAFALRGAILCLFPLDKLAGDARAEPEYGGAGIRFSLSMLASSAEEVDERARLATAAGATITKEPTDAEFFPGRSCYFADPESNYWEIVWIGGDSTVLSAARRAAGESSG